MSLIAVMNQLYEIGFWGFLHVIDEHKTHDLPKTRVIPPTLQDGKRYVFDFHYLNRYENIATSLSQKDLVCTHPIFFDYCDQTPHPTLLLA